ncbi:MAG: hypothetical protein JWN08_814, partial [Frankiales bacterium]|nr:hypothetical protein [Frankiales bacterium]
MRRVLPLSAALVVALLGVPAAAAQDQGELRAELDRATARATALSGELERAAAQDGGHRVALERLEQDHEAARARLD